jgi:hypothetical protein
MPGSRALTRGFPPPSQVGGEKIHVPEGYMKKVNAVCPTSGEPEKKSRENLVDPERIFGFRPLSRFDDHFRGRVRGCYFDQKPLFRDFRGLRGLRGRFLTLTHPLTPTATPTLRETLRKY